MKFDHGLANTVLNKTDNEQCGRLHLLRSEVILCDNVSGEGRGSDSEDYEPCLS